MKKPIKLNKILCLVMTLLLLVGCGNKPSGSAAETETVSNVPSKPIQIESYPIMYENVSDMMVYYNNVAAFEVLSTSVTTGKSVTGENYVTVSKVKILDVFNGKLKKSQVINVIQEGDDIHQTFQKINESLGLYKKGQRYLGFLYEMDDSSEYLQSIHDKYRACNYTGEFLINQKNEILKFPSEYNIFPNAKTVEDIVKEIK